MKQWVFVLIMSLLALLGLSLFGGLIFNFDPSEAGAAIKTMVYLTLFFGLTGLFSLACCGYRKFFRKRQNVEMDFWTGIAASAIVIIGMIILSKL